MSDLEEDHLMRSFIVSFALLAIAAFAPAAQAVPLALPAAPPSDVIAVRNGCGLGWHRGPYGFCRPNAAPYRYYPYAYYGPPRPPARCWWVDRGHGPREVCAW
jgi:hypothetical protein